MKVFSSIYMMHFILHIFTAFLTHSYSIPIGIAAGTLVCIVLTATAVFICACMRMKQRRIAHAAILHESEINQAARDSDNIASIKT